MRWIKWHQWMPPSMTGQSHHVSINDVGVSTTCWHVLHIPTNFFFYFLHFSPWFFNNYLIQTPKSNWLDNMQRKRRKIKEKREKNSKLACHAITRLVEVIVTRLFSSTPHNHLLTICEAHYTRLVSLTLHHLEYLIIHYKGIQIVSAHACISYQWLSRAYMYH
jgi:hypothetical protein